MTPFVWMFISSYEKLREEIIEKHYINNLGYYQPSKKTSKIGSFF
jgi:hypothetical protein